MPPRAKVVLIGRRETRKPQIGWLRASDSKFDTHKQAKTQQAKTRRPSAETRSLAPDQTEELPIGGASPGFFGTVQVRSGESRKTLD